MFTCKFRSFLVSKFFNDPNQEVKKKKKIEKTHSNMLITEKLFHLMTTHEKAAV